MIIVSRGTNLQGGTKDMILLLDIEDHIFNELK